MRLLIQRVAGAQVDIDGKTVGRIGRGLLVYVGVGTGDTVAQARWLAEKLVNLRVFEDEEGRLNCSVQESKGSILAVSNFTLLADARKGRRPSFCDAAKAEDARVVHEAFLEALRQTGVPLACGVFGASMNIFSDACGPVNIILDAPAND